MSAYRASKQACSEGQGQLLQLHSESPLQHGLCEHTGRFQELVHLVDQSIKYLLVLHLVSPSDFLFYFPSAPSQAEQSQAEASHLSQVHQHTQTACELSDFPKLSI